MFLRKQILEGSGDEILFLWGARQTGKSTLLKSLFPKALWFDLLLSETFLRYKTDPAQFRQVILASSPVRTVVVDEIQKIPDEVKGTNNVQPRLTFNLVTSKD